MTDVFMFTAAIVIGIALLAMVALPMHERNQRAWFQSIIEASDEELAARPRGDLTRDYRRMADIECRIRTREVIGRAGITAVVAGEQRSRLRTALEGEGN